MARAVVMRTTGLPGAGKSYRRGPHFLINEFLPESDGDHVSNLPLFPDKIARRATRGVPKHKRKDAMDRVTKRIKSIPDDELKRWECGDSYPGDYFGNQDIKGSHICIDEVHNFCGVSHSAAHRRRWAEWFGEVRHLGVTVEVITQHPDKLAKEVSNHCAVHLSIVPLDEERDPVLGCKLGDWLQLLGKLKRGYVPMSTEIRKVNEDGKWVVKERKNFSLTKEYYSLYNSYNDPQKGGSGGKGEKEPCEKYGWPRLIWWFLDSNIRSLLPRFAIVAGLVWLGYFGGMGIIIRKGLAYMNGAMTSMIDTNVVSDDPAPGPDQASPAERSAEPSAATVPEDNIQATTQPAPDDQGEPTIPSPQPTTNEEADFPGVTMIAEGFAMLETGEVIEPGQWIRVGREWHECIEVDNERRTVRFHTGVMLRYGSDVRLRFVHDEPNRGPSAADPGLPADLPAKPDRSADGPDTDSPGDPDYLLGQAGPAR